MQTFDGKVWFLLASRNKSLRDKFELQKTTFSSHETITSTNELIRKIALKLILLPVKTVF